MKKITSFRGYEGPGWPDRHWLAPYFLTPAGRQAVFGFRNNHWGLKARGVDGTEDMPFPKEIDINLHIIGKPELGVLLHYERLSVADGYGYFSLRNPKMLRTLVEAKPGTRMPLGLFIPFEQALQVVVEFIDTNGVRPKSVEWISEADMPEGSFPEPDVTLRS
jgi:hypothetical protein